MKFQYASGDSPLDGYTIMRGIGIGGFGEVYFAESDSGKEVALKRIQKNMDVEMRGVRHCLNLRHPNLVAIYDIRFDKDQQGWIVMEFIEGESLRETLDHWPSGMPADQAIPLFAQICAGVTYLHDQGIVHRDLKPANIFIDSSFAKIGDYGLSKYISASRRGGQTESVGTFHYMAPEIGKGEYGKEIDVYSLGIILFEMLTGNVPFDGESTQEIILKHLTADPDLHDVPEPYANIIQRALAKNPSLRFRDGRELLSALGYNLESTGLASKRTFSEENANFDSANPSIDPTAARPVYVNASEEVTDAVKERASIDAVDDHHATLKLGYWSRFEKLLSLRWEQHQTLLAKEPVGKAIILAKKDLYDRLQAFPKSSRDVVYVCIIIVALLNASWLIPLALPMLAVYLGWHAVWFVFGNEPIPTRSLPNQQNTRKTAGAAPKLRPAVGLQETVHYEARETNSKSTSAGVGTKTSQSVAYVKPSSSKEAWRRWQDTQREDLRARNFWTSLHATTRSITFAGFIASTLAIAGVVLAYSHPALRENINVGAVAWLAIMTTASSWAILTLSRRWEVRDEDSIAFRFVLMVAGLILGAISYQLSEYLLVPWADILTTSPVDVSLDDRQLSRQWRGFYDEAGFPLLAGHMAYFATLFWAVRWWRQSDILRRKRFSILTIVWSVLIAALIQGIFYFPAPWALILAGATSFIVQLASPWIDSSRIPESTIS
ncbi:MAG: serine/threonine protein kinase [Planctomycetes bacterium]|nr:serine/threonine protein kinase [Planctomycetota bacterium]